MLNLFNSNFQIKITLKSQFFTPTSKMLLLIHGPQKSGKHAIVDHLTTNHAFVELPFNENIFYTLVQAKQWKSNFVSILPTIKDWPLLKKRPCARLIIIYPSNNAEWRHGYNDDDFYQNIQLHEDAFKVPNFGSLDDLYCHIEKCIIKIRPSWDKYFMDIACMVLKRANCMKGKVGCVITKDNRIVSTGYNGTPSKAINCYEDGCKRCNIGARANEGLEYCYCIHAEENAVLFISKEKCEGGTMYVTTFPCQLCCRKIVQMGIKRVVYMNSYGSCDDIVMKLFVHSNVEVKRIEMT